MDSRGRLKQLIENGITVHQGHYYPLKAKTTKLLGIFPDGSREYAAGVRGTLEAPYHRRKGTNLYEQMMRVLQHDGVDVSKLGNKIEIEVHTLEMADGNVYQFLLPTTRYF